MKRVKGVDGGVSLEFRSMMLGQRTDFKGASGKPRQWHPGTSRRSMSWSWRFSSSIPGRYRDHIRCHSARAPASLNASMSSSPKRSRFWRSLHRRSRGSCPAMTWSATVDIVRLALERRMSKGRRTLSRRSRIVVFLTFGAQMGPRVFAEPTLPDLIAVYDC